MKTRTKRAIIISQVPGLVIGLVLFFILILGVGILKAGFEDTDRDLCKAGVSAQAAIMSLPEGKNIIKPDCKTYNVVFYDDRVEINGKLQPVYDSRQRKIVTSFNGLTNDIVNQVLAEEQRWCWYQYLEGKKFVIDRQSWIAILKTKQTRLCVLCDEVTFDSNIMQSQFTGFYDYTKTHTMSSSSMTYYSYYAEGQPICTDYPSPPINCWESYFADQIAKDNPQMMPQNTPTFNTNTNEKYVVVFIMRGKKDAKFDILSESDVDFFSYVLPFDELTNQCDRLQRGSVE